MKTSVFDLHCDTAVELYLQHKLLEKNDLQIDLSRAKQLDSYMQFFSFCCVYDQQGKQRPQQDAEQLFLASLEAFREQCRDKPFTPLLSVEGPEVIDCDPGRLEWLQQQGFRMTTLTWNYRNALAGSCMTGEGLTDRGREFVKEAQRLGIVIDVSHLSDRAFWDLIDITANPIVASHSNSRVCCNNARNLTDDQFRAIRDLGGLVGMNLYTPFLNESGKATFDDVRRHLDRWLTLGGEKTVALGADLDGCEALPASFSGIESYPSLADYLNGYDVAALFSENASRFFRTSF